MLAQCWATLCAVSPKLDSEWINVLCHPPGIQGVEEILYQLISQRGRLRCICSELADVMLELSMTSIHDIDSMLGQCWATKMAQH